MKYLLLPLFTLAFLFCPIADAASQSDGASEASEHFLKWQLVMLEERAKKTERLRSIMAHKITVPSPDVHGNHEDPPIRMEFPSVATLGILPSFDMGLRLGEPRMKVKFQGKMSVFNLFAAEHERLIWTSTDGSAAFMSAKTNFGVSTKADVDNNSNISFGISGHDLTSLKSGVNVSSFLFSGEIAAKDGAVNLAGGVGPNLIPNAWKAIATARLQLKAEASLPVAVTDVQWKSHWGASQVANGATHYLVRYLSDRTACPLCHERGAITCRGCTDKKAVPCPTCQRGGKISCSTCSGGGRVSCPTTRRCGSCRGTGTRSCSSCSGSGSTTVYDNVPGTETRWGKRPVAAGFDKDGNPYYTMESYSYEVSVMKSVARSVSCDSCGGSGNGGPCGACDGGGTVICSICSGTGHKSCDTCDGAGTLRCPTCRGRMDILCPTCRGKTFECPICEGIKLKDRR